MADTLYLSLWFPNFRFAALPTALTCVLRQITPSAELPGVRAAQVYPINWGGAHVYQRIYDADELNADEEGDLQAQLDGAVREATEQMHEDYAYEFEVYLDLWVPPADPGGHWLEEPMLLRVAGFGPEFEDGAFEQNGQVRLEFGNDAPFLYQEDTHIPESMMRVQQNVARLLDLTARIEKNCNLASRLLWSDSEDDIAQKLLKQLQRLN